MGRISLVAIDPLPWIRTTMLLTAFLLALTAQSHALTPAAAQSETLFPQRIAAGDLDGDGRTDLYIANPAGGRLLVRDANGALSPALPDRVPSVPGRSASWSDVDEDGDLDLFVWGADAGHLLLNESGVLWDATAESGLLHPGGLVTGIDWLDLDADGTADLVLSATRGVLGFRNLGEAHFEAIDLGPLAPATVAPAASPPNAKDPSTPGDSPASHAPSSPSEIGPESSAPPSPPQAHGGRGHRRSVASGAPYQTPGGGSSAALQFGGFCAARIRDTLNGGCLQASATPTLGMLMPLSTAFNLDAATGNTGFGTTSPETRIQIVGGSDVTTTGGGNIQFGFSSGQNLAIDENEIMARNNGASSSLYVNNEGGNVLFSANGTGKVGIGIAHPSGRLHVVDSVGGDGSVVLPLESISPDELWAEPGVASAWSPSISLGLKGLIPTTVLSKTLTAPKSGFVVATAFVSLLAPASSGTYKNDLTLQTSSAAPASFEIREVLSQGESRNTSWTRVFPVPQGNTTFYIVGEAFDSLTGPNLNSAGLAKKAGITLQFFSTAYGSVN